MLVPVNAWALGDSGPPPLTPTRVLSAWTANPPVLLVVVLLAAAYLAGVRALGRRGETWPRSRSLCFLVGGVGTIALVGLSVLGVYSGTLFWARALQNLLLVMFAPMFLALGAPLTLLRETLPPRARSVAGAVLHSRLARVLTFPPVVTLVLVVPPLVLYFSPLYEQTLRSSLVSGLVGVLLVFSGFVYYWSRLRVDPVPSLGSYLVTMWITLVEVLVDAALGIVLWLGPVIATGYYLGVGRSWGPDLRVDQDIGAGILWIGGDIIGLPFLATVAVRMSKEDEDSAVQIDAELDAAEVEEASAHEGAGDAEPTPARLWWEEVPELAERTRGHGA
jgi:cytochrome c oxidase assembly factor CtaG